MCEKKEDLQKRISYLEGKLSEMEQVNASYVKQTDIMLQAIRAVRPQAEQGGVSVSDDSKCGGND